MQKITTFLWYDDQAEEAVRHYTSVFDDSRVVQVQRYGEAGPGTPGTVMTVVFELAGQRFIALNGGPHHTFTEAISLYVDCATQEEVDALWRALGEGGQHGPCGWLKDRFGVSWQIVPTVLTELLSDPDPVRSDRVMRAMLTMSKLDIQALRDAYEG
ncbi:MULTISPECIES: VOC family protein [Streptomycetaceae]|uniref:3-demethylubiquinone-9 3-methyltransferase n=1 Tax=Streptantibioticus cattleyicolor (strain ATCC 35852 / DSM 46488 / JCM 4925 / NBRC 14057 / NRRL 8057) TaxID=1003195 RepID=F8JUX7_STREN|nr:MULTISPECIES: VOC family protein [Streptomycetaceae]AEW98139.1 3-demethylubiquinone-9 3-methyltransferase [Streptantibioticus cattleyicolor NRRL 8057 = DSM 46488]MYS62528.1 VOC family protein [Streptomyces sp. SID5468]CCB78452.1 3-demethylubiquinone-9 3-methyltransferase [Streptantibioticus cattleyicolor NRRL 8057 = DSM 46488]